MRPKIPRANRLWIEMGLVPDPARCDFDYHQRMIRTLHQPWLLDRPFRFTPEYLARMWKATGFENRNRARMNVPKEWVFAHRLELGLYALLAKLGATANWRAKLLDALYAPGEPRPQPFSEHELVALLQTAVVQESRASGSRSMAWVPSLVGFVFVTKRAQGIARNSKFG